MKKVSCKKYILSNKEFHEDQENNSIKYVKTNGKKYKSFDKQDILLFIDFFHKYH